MQVRKKEITRVYNEIVSHIGDDEPSWYYAISRGSELGNAIASRIKQILEKDIGIPIPIMCMLCNGYLHLKFIRSSNITNFIIKTDFWATFIVVQQNKSINLNKKIISNLYLFEDYKHLDKIKDFIL